MKHQEEQLFMSNDNERHRKVSPNADLYFANRGQYNPPYTTSPAPPHHSAGFEFKPSGEISKEQGLIDWINSFNDPYCLLVNSFRDLRDGIALCHLVGYIACSLSD